MAALLLALMKIAVGGGDQLEYVCRYVQGAALLIMGGVDDRHAEPVGLAGNPDAERVLGVSPWAGEVRRARTSMKHRFDDLAASDRFTIVSSPLSMEIRKPSLTALSTSALAICSCSDVLLIENLIS